MPRFSAMISAVVIFLPGVVLPVPLRSESSETRTDGCVEDVGVQDERSGAAIREAEVEIRAGEIKFANKSELKERFGELQFGPQGGFLLTVGQQLPPLVWEHPDIVARVVKEPTIRTRWFNDQFDEVTVAKEPGRYYAYGEAPVPSGPDLRRAMTCYCAGPNADIKTLAAAAISTSDSSRETLQAEVAANLQRWRTTEEGAVELSAQVESGLTAQDVRIGQWQMENATRHVLLKRKLMGLDATPTVKATVRPLTGNPAPELRTAPLDQAGISAAQVMEIERRLDAWFAASQEPFAVVIAKNGVVIVEKSYGMLNGEPVTIDTPMLLHSAMKPLIGLQLAMWVDRGYFKLDEPIGKYLPDFRSPEDRNLTFRAAHIHATGIHFPWELAFRKLFYFHTWHESLIAHCKREWAPGTRQRYGVVGVILSVRALELLRGRNYWDAMERDLFEPLGIRNVLPGGTGFSAENLARIGVVMANRGKYGPWEVISEPTYEAIIPTSMEPYFPNLKIHYGIGFQRASQHLGTGSYGHGGGCGTVLAINPDKHVVFAMVRNNRGPDYAQHLSGVTRILKAWIGN